MKTDAKYIYPRSIKTGKYFCQTNETPGFYTEKVSRRSWIHRKKCQQF